MLSLYLRGKDADAVADANWKRAMDLSDKAHGYAMSSIKLDGAQARIAQQAHQLRVLSALTSANFDMLSELVNLNDATKLHTVRNLRSRLFDKLLNDCIHRGAIDIDPRFDPQWVDKSNYVPATKPLQQRLPAKFPNLTGLTGLPHLLKIEQWTATDIEIMHACFTASYQVIGQIVDLNDPVNANKIHARSSRKIDAELNKSLANGAIKVDPRRDPRWAAAYHYIA